MAILQILTLPDPRLTQPAIHVQYINQTLIKDMFQTMYFVHGIGLAAPQVGVLERIFILDLSQVIDGAKATVFVNPEITYRSKETWIAEEGCLSLPEKYSETYNLETVGPKYLHYNVSRSVEVGATYYDEEFQRQNFKASGWEARGFQHEFDHLRGVTIDQYETWQNYEL